MTGTSRRHEEQLMKCLFGIATLFPRLRHDGTEHDAGTEVVVEHGNGEQRRQRCERKDQRERQPMMDRMRTPSAHGRRSWRQRARDAICDLLRPAEPDAHAHQRAHAPVRWQVSHAQPAIAPRYQPPAGPGGPARTLQRNALNISCSSYLRYGALMSVSIG